ncbi:MAG: ferric reductase-like transmembrane domain-containing protein [Pusillimonas sp.]|nr:ferric reductase-like transmembrane domain-containing protein [Pusillimonas sp.]
MKTKTTLLLLISFLTLAWAWNALYLTPLSGDGLWVIRQYGLYLSGQLSIAMMSVSMILATRPGWLEPLFKGMDKMYNVHKWTGIAGAGFAITHWLLKEAGDPISSLIGKTGRPKLDALPFAQSLHSFGKDIGEWGFYILLLMVALSLWKAFPYRSWRRIHKIMPAIYLLLVAHTIILMPASYWASLNGAVMVALLLAGTISTFITVAKRIGRRHQYVGRVTMVRPHEDQTLEVSCDPGANWPGHSPGQFALLTFDPREGPHPFTIAGAPRESKQTLTFQIKNLGDYTGKLGRKLTVDQPVIIEGPYGRFNFRQGRPRASQVWLAAGIGITPFLAWLDALQNKTLDRHTALHYVVTKRTGDRFVSLLEMKSRSIGNLELHIHDTQKQGRFLASHFLNHLYPNKKNIDLWYCGPASLARSIHKEAKQQNIANLKIHQEIFNFR